MNTLRIVRVPILPLGMVNAHLILADRGCVLSGIEKFYLGHGGPLTAREVERHALTLLAIRQEDVPHMTKQKGAAIF